MNFNFIAANDFDLNFFNDIGSFVDHFPDYQTVFLEDEKQLMLLLDEIGVINSTPVQLNSTEFHKCWDISGEKLPVFTDGEYDNFYHRWLTKSGRDNNMDEYGNLIFLQGLSAKWNELKYRFVVLEC